MHLVLSIEYVCNNNVWVNIISVCAQAVLGGSDAETLGGNTSFQSGANGGGPAASTPAQDGGASAAEAAVQRASDAVKQLQQNAANLGRRLLRA